MLPWHNIIRSEIIINTSQCILAIISDQIKKKRNYTERVIDHNLKLSKAIDNYQLSLYVTLM